MLPIFSRNSNSWSSVKYSSTENIWVGTSDIWLPIVFCVTWVLLVERDGCLVSMTYFWISSDYRDREAENSEILMVEREVWHYTVEI